MKQIGNKLLIILITTTTLFLTGCYSVFYGGTGGRVVDAESTSNPKQGIGDVDVYAYIENAQRNSDFNNWDGISKFTPNKNNYYGHTITESDGSFSISHLVWKNFTPEFGKDADVSTVYLLFYHENYGLTKGETLIISDSTSDTVYKELNAINKTTSVTINLIDVATDSQTTNTINVELYVPQTTEAHSSLTPKKYTQTITGSGTISISYPRWQNEEDKQNGIETTPEVKLIYNQNTEDSEVTWKACYNGNSTNSDYSFIDNPQINKTISGSSYTIKLYGKSTKLSIPTINGQYKTTGDESDDGIKIGLKAKGTGTNFTIDCGEKTTSASTIGTSGTQSHGNFSNLGTGSYWKDETYTDKYAETEVQFYINETPGTTIKVKSNESSYTVQLP